MPVPKTNQLSTVVPPLSGESKALPKTIEEFCQIAEADYQHSYNVLVEEFKARKQHVAHRRDRKIEEYTAMCNMVQLNTLLNQNQVEPALLMQVERHLAGLHYGNILSSFTISHWCSDYGETNVLPLLCDVMHYFLRQFQVKEMLSDVQIGHLVVKLIAAQPHLRVMELMFIMREALAGHYGPTYQRIGIDTILGWLSQFYHNSASYLESTRINQNPEATHGDAPWEVIEKRLKAYEDEQRQKKRITDKVWNTTRNPIKVYEGNE